MRVAVDIGGTFTDFVLFDERTGELRTFKRFSTPGDPAEAVLHGLSELSGGEPPSVVHGSTVATNALLERRGARTALVVTEGFRDLLTIGRQNRASIYDLAARRPRPLIQADLCFEVTERVTHEGRALIPLEAGELPRLVEKLRACGAESVAVSLLFSFLLPDHERAVAETLRAGGFAVSASSEILPEFREYERTSTTAVNAYLSPVVDRYVGRLESSLRARDLRIMQSNGGSTRAVTARSQAVRSLLSGPAGGVVGALHVARLGGHERVISFDMGGTSTDVSLADGGVRLTSEGEIDGIPIRVPIIDIHTVGAGGGSIARVDAAGALRVGPRSAGAEPGPICYGRGGTLPTITDANLVLGRLAADRFLGGEFRLDAEAARAALEKLGREAGVAARDGLDLARVAALGVIRVANAGMERALRRVSVERGHDPADFVLVSFGGAGGLHACELARALGAATVMVPRGASTLSAFGMLVAHVVRDYVQTVMLPGETPHGRLVDLVAPLAELGAREIAREGVPAEEIAVYRELDVRYVGQSYELTVPLCEGYADTFHGEHQR
ncbi:MAG: hydantoinase/oxoprolinase family protein, partial [Gemmatimonadota bacterium]